VNRQPGPQAAVQALQTKAHLMAITIYATLLPVCSFILGVFGFFVGRCSRKIPVLDEKMPRVLHRGQLQPKDSAETRLPNYDWQVH
jgi:hypothetical protein